MLISKRINILGLIAVLLILSGCSSVKIPKTVHKAKNRIERNAREIRAIAEYHNLANPLRVSDTILVKVPSLDGGFLSSGRIDRNFNEAFDRYIFPTFIEIKDTVEVERIRTVLKTASCTVDSVYEDEYIVIKLSLLEGKLAVNYAIKERNVEAPVNYDAIVIDTNVKWYEDRFVRLIAFIIAICAFIIITMFGLKRGSQ